MRSSQDAGLPAACWEVGPLDRRQTAALLDALAAMAIPQRPQIGIGLSRDGNAGTLWLRDGSCSARIIPALLAAGGRQVAEPALAGSALIIGWPWVARWAAAPDWQPQALTAWERAATACAAEPGASSGRSSPGGDDPETGPHEAGYAAWRAHRVEPVPGAALCRDCQEPLVPAGGQRSAARAARPVSAPGAGGR